MTDRKKNFDDETLRAHLESKRYEKTSHESSPSLVSLVEGDNNTVFKPVTFLSIIGTVIFAIVTTVTQIINFNNTFSEMEATIDRNVAQVIDVRDELNDVRESIRNKLATSDDSSMQMVEDIANRVSGLERKINEELRFTTNEIKNNKLFIDRSMEELKDDLRELKSTVRDKEKTINKFETKLRVLEIRYERITENK